MIYDEINDVLNIKSSLELTPALQRFSKIFDCQSCSYLGLSIPDNNGSKTAFGYSTYNLKWINKYTESNYHLIDPVVRNSIQRILPLDWQDVRHENKHSEAFFLEAQAHGIAVNGLSFPIRGKLGEIALFSVNVDANHKEWAFFKNKHMRNLQVAAHAYHEKALELKGVSNKKTSLSNREAEILKWLACGKSQSDIATILGISQNTVRYHVINVKNKMNAVTVAQAVANAVSCSDIQL